MKVEPSYESFAAAYQAGNFAINGRRYNASGIFMGQR